MNKNLKILSFVCFGVSQFAFGQIKDERLILDRKREPEVKRNEKKKTSNPAEKKYPPKEKKIQDSLNLKYDITDVPAVSEFKTSTIQGADITPKFNSEYQDNYFQLGFGNYSKMLADANISTVLENKMQLGADVHYLSTSGLKKVYDWDSDQRTINVGAYLNNYGDLGKFNINVDYNRDDYNYYGIYMFKPTSDINIEQSVNQFHVNGYYDFYSNEILNDVRVKSTFLKDHYGAKENLADITANLSKHGVDVNGDISLNADLGLGIESQKTEFDLLNKNKSNFFNFGITPKITLFKGNSYLMLGSNFSLASGKNEGAQLAQEEKLSKTYWFPKAELMLAATDEFSFYAGVDGGLKFNSYANSLQQNPYMLSDLYLKPTRSKYHVYFGMKGDIEEDFKYDISAGFGKLEDIMFFRGNDYMIHPADGSYGYGLANTFNTAYDNGTLSEVKASLQYFPLENLALDGEIKFQKYKLDNFSDIYNVPLIRAEIGAKYTMLDKKLLLGFKGFFVSDRTTNSYEAVAGPASFNTQESTNTKVGGYADLNLSAEYKIHKNFSIFANGNNLLNAKYQTFNGYKVLGAQILGGVKITF